MFSCTDGSSVVALSVLSLLFLFLVLLLLLLLLVLLLLLLLLVVVVVVLVLVLFLILLSLWLLLLLFARTAAVRGGNLKIKKAGGGLGGRAQRLPPSALAGGLTCV